MRRFSISPAALAALGLLSPLALEAVFAPASHAGAGHNHGGGSEEELREGETRVTPVITLEGHGGFENNLTTEGKPSHYAIDGLFGAVFEWGLPNDGSFSIEAAIGPALVWGEAEHFYGKVHLDEHDDHAAEGGAHEVLFGRPARPGAVRGPAEHIARLTGVGPSVRVPSAVAVDERLEIVDSRVHH